MLAIESMGTGVLWVGVLSEGQIRLKHESRQRANRRAIRAEPKERGVACDEPVYSIFSDAITATRVQSLTPHCHLEYP